MSTPGRAEALQLACKPVVLCHYSVQSLVFSRVESSVLGARTHPLVGGRGSSRFDALEHLEGDRGALVLGSFDLVGIEVAQ